MNTIKLIIGIRQTAVASLRLSFILLIILALFQYKAIMGQDQNSIAWKMQDRSVLNLSHQHIEMPKFDLVQPTLISYGKGLMYYEYTYLEPKQYHYSLKDQRKESLIKINATYTEMELEVLKKNLLFINKQYRIQIKEMIRKEKMDLNLGEAIKGFYTKPVF